MSVMLKAELVGDPEMVITRLVPAHSNDASGIAFAESKRYIQSALDSQVGAMIVSPLAEGITKPHLKSSDPRMAFGTLLHLSLKSLPLTQGIHPTAVISPTATIDSSAHIGSYCVIESGAIIEAGARIFPYCYIGDHCKVGEGTRLMPRVTLVQDIVIGKNCILHSGAVIGADGLGFVWDGEQRVKIPHVGGVIIGDNVEIGANTCVDRATCGETVIGEGVKLDNLVQIAHNVQLGDHTVIAAFVGVSGSATIGKRVMMGGQAAVRDHGVVGDDVVLAGRTGVMSDVTEPGEYFGLPATPMRESMRQLAAYRRLPDLLDRVKTLEKRIAELEK